MGLPGLGATTLIMENQMAKQMHICMEAGYTWRFGLVDMGGLVLSASALTLWTLGTGALHHRARSSVCQRSLLLESELSSWSSAKHVKTDRTAVVSLHVKDLRQQQYSHLEGQVA